MATRAIELCPLHAGWYYYSIFLNEYRQRHYPKALKWFWDAYTSDPAQRREIYAAPLQATTEQLAGLPPALVQVAGNDVLRAEGLAYARKLDTAGVDVTVVNYENLIHDYGLLNAISQVPAVRDALHQTGEFLRKHLHIETAAKGVNK